MDRKISDIDFCKLYDDETGEYYEEAVGLLDTKPIQACQELRKAGEAYCKKTLKHLNVAFKDLRLINLSVLLSKQGAIYEDVYTKLDRLRRLCNDKAHSRRDGSNKSFEDLIEEAREARQILIKVVQMTFTIVYSDMKKPDFEIRDVDILKHKDKLYEAITSTDKKVLMSAGLLLESIAKKQYLDRKHGKQALEYQINEKDALEHTARNCNLINRVAAEFYKSACEISAIKYLTGMQHERSDTDFDISAKVCDLEPLFLYGNILYECNNRGMIRAEGLKYLEIAASRGDADAALVYGENLYYDKKYKQASKYLNIAANNDNTEALCLLFYCYSSGDVTDSEVELSLTYLHKAINLGSPNAKAILGKQYCIGRIVPKNILLGERLLQEAANEGSLLAKSYNLYRSLTTVHCCACKPIHGGAVQNQTQRRSKAKRNEPCPCGSGKKYKQCCGK